jgi:flavin reductase (DIM6/NTAB) family NADH-FMN oxidoreductase RutF
MAFLHIDPQSISVQERYRLLQGGVAPRPIALVSTLSVDGWRNLSPFSFFNTFGGNPPVVVFSPSRRQRDGSVKDTYNNLMATKECVIHAVTYDMVQQVSLASTEYPSDVDEFVKSGLTPIASDVVKPPRVAESPFHMECRLMQMVPTGDGPGAGNLAVCEVVRFHVAEELFTGNQIDPQKIDLVARNSADWYTRASGDAIFYVKKPIDTRGVGYDQIPDFIRQSDIFSANNLGQLGNSEKIPTESDVRAFADLYPAGERDESLLRRSQWAGDFRTMFQVARKIATSDQQRGANLIDQSARLALDRANDTDFAWQAALFAQLVRTGQAQ